MTPYLTVENKSKEERIPVEKEVGIYRDPDRDDEIVVTTKKEDIPLGVSDAAVSRMNDGTPPVIISPISQGVEVQNVNNTNGVTVRTVEEDQSLEEGESARVEQDASIDIGHLTTINICNET